MSVPQFLQPVAEKVPWTRPQAQTNTQEQEPAEVGGGDAGSNTDADSVATDSTLQSQQSVDNTRVKKKSSYKPKKPKVWTPQKEDRLIELVKEDLIYSRWTTPATTTV